MNKFLIGALYFCFTIFVCEQTIFAQNCKSNVKFCYTNGVLRLYGEGETPNYNIYQCPWAYLSDSVRTVVIGDSITKLGGGEFQKFHNLTKVIWGARINQLGWFTFSYCTSLDTISVPKTIIIVGQGTFFCCKRLRHVDWASGCPFPGQTFGGCESLSDIQIPKGTRTLSGLCFSHCRKLTSLDLPSTVDTIETCAIYGTPKLKYLIIRNNKLPYINSTSLLRYEVAGENGAIMDRQLQNVTLVVPKETVETYKLHWKNYVNNVIAIDDFNKNVNSN